MKAPFLVALTLFLAFSLSGSSHNKPVIGIFTTPSDFENEFNPRDYSYVKHSYAEMIEEGGGFPVIIPWDSTEEDLKTLLRSVNGILFTGGDAELTVKSESTGKMVLGKFTLRVREVIDFVVQKNDEGEYLPVLSICQGPQAISMAISEDPDLFNDYDHEAKNDHLIFGEHGRNSRLFSLYPEKLFKHLEENPIMYFQHEYGIKPDVLKTHPKLKDFFNIIAEATDSKDKVFVAAIEAKNYPIYGVQYHPENTLQQYRKSKGDIDRNNDDFQSIVNIAKFFISEAKKSTHEFPLDDEYMQRYRVENGERVYMDPKWYDVYFYRNGDIAPDQLDFYDFRLLRKFKLA